MARAFDITQASRSVPARRVVTGAVSAPQFPAAAVFGIWLAAALTSWMLVGLVVAAIWLVVM